MPDETDVARCPTCQSRDPKAHPAQVAGFYTTLTATTGPWAAKCDDAFHRPVRSWAVEVERTATAVIYVAARDMREAEAGARAAIEKGDVDDGDFATGADRFNPIEITEFPEEAAGSVWHDGDWA